MWELDFDGLVDEVEVTNELVALFVDVEEGREGIGLLGIVENGTL